MRFLVLIKASKDSEAGTISRRAMEEMGNFNEALAKDGVLIALDGLHPSAKGTRIRFEGGRATPTDGPFAETKELIAGYWIVKADSRADVVERFSHAPLDDGAELEVRQLFDLEDLDEDVAAGIRERRERVGWTPAEHS